MSSPRNVAQTFRQDYIFERFGEGESPTKAADAVKSCRSRSVPREGSTFDTPSIDVTYRIDVDKRVHLELLRKSRSLKLTCTGSSTGAR
jgi:hypothetical protein